MHKFIEKYWFDWKKEIIKHKSLALYKMGKEIKIYGSIEVEKPKFH